MNVRQIIYTLCVFVFLSCSSKPEKQVEYLNGYWEIVQVKKNNQILKEYTINTIVDYFEMTDSITGYRKKVAPTLDGKYLINEHQINFDLRLENDSLHLIYNNDGTITKETILKLNATELIIANSQGFKYFYKPFESIQLGDE